MISSHTNTFSFARWSAIVFRVAISEGMDLATTNMPETVAQIEDTLRRPPEVAFEWQFACAWLMMRRARSGLEVQRTIGGGGRRSG